MTTLVLTALLVLVPGILPRAGRMSRSGWRSPWLAGLG